MAKFCKNCGAPLKEGVRFCEHCGSPVEQPAAQAPRCVYCGAAMKETSQFCPICGKAVGGSTPDTAGNTVPAGQNEALSQMYQTAAQRGIHVAASNDPRAAGSQRSNPSQKRQSSIKTPIKVVAVLLAVAILFTGLVTPGWMRRGGKGTTNGDDLYATVTLPALNRETECTLSVANMAVEAQINAMLTEEKFYRAVDEGRSLDEIEALLEQNAEAWEAADVLSSGTFMMSTRLREAEKTKGYQYTLAAVPSAFEAGNPFVISASAADPYNMDRFDTAQEWAEYITQLYDHAKGDKTAKLAKVLKTDVSRARKVIQMSQDILRGESESQADSDTEVLKALQLTKATGKVAGAVLAAGATGGASMGVLSATGFVAGSMDAIIEMTDTTLQLKLGEDHWATKSFQEASGKLAPVIAIASLPNLGSWEKDADIVGNLRYIADTIVDLSNGKVFGFDFSSKGGDGKEVMTVVCVPVGENMTPKEIEKAAEALGKLGFDQEAVKEALASEPGGKEAEIVEKPFSELSDKELDKWIEDTSLTDAEWEQLFQELYDEFLEEMAGKGLLPEDDDIWAYDPFLPPEDLPQEGDDEGDRDDPSKWSKPEKPDDGEKEPPELEEGPEKYEGYYEGTRDLTQYIDGVAEHDHYEETNYRVPVHDGVPKPMYPVGHDQKWDPESGTGSGNIYDPNNDIIGTYEFRFEESGGKLKLFIDADYPGDPSGFPPKREQHWELEYTGKSKKY